MTEAMTLLSGDAVVNQQSQCPRHRERLHRRLRRSGARRHRNGQRCGWVFERLAEPGRDVHRRPGGTASWTFTGGTNYNDASGDVAITISKATASVTVSGYTGIYDGNGTRRHGSASGVGGVNLSASLNLGATFTDVPGGTASWTFSGGTNYNDQSGDAAVIISKANALVTVNGYTGVYDAAAHGATGLASGVGGVDLSAC